MVSIVQEHYYFTLEYISGGGLLMLPLMAVSIVMWSLIIQKTLFFRKLYQKKMTQHEAGKYIQAGAIQNRARGKGAAALLVETFLARRSGISSVDKNIMDETVMVITASLDRSLSMIGILAGIAPLIGLLGTVTGMIDVFDVISLFGAGHTKGMAGGISEALITTQTGLLIAIPGFYMNHFLIRRSINLKHRIASMGIFLKRYI